MPKIMLFKMGAIDKIGLKYLVNYHRMTGNTYFLNELSMKKFNLKTIILVLYNLFVLGIYVFGFYTVLAQDKTTIIFYHGENISNPAKRNILLIINNMGFGGFSVLTLFSSIFLTFKGNQILDHLKRESYPNVSNKFEKRVALIIIFIQFMFSFSIEIFFTTITTWNNFGLSSAFNDLFKLITDNIRFSLAMNSQLMIVSLIAYKSYLVSNDLTNFEINLNSKENLKLMFEFIQNKQNSVKHFDKIITNCILVTIVINSLNLLSLSNLAINPKEFLLFTVGVLIESLTILWTLCYFCDIIPKSFREFIHKLNDQFLEMYSNSSEFSEYCLIINRIKEMKDEMCFTIFNQYVVNIKTFISCIAVITSYVIIIIQTNV